MLFSFVTRWWWSGLIGAVLGGYALYWGIKSDSEFLAGARLERAFVVGSHGNRKTPFTTLQVQLAAPKELDMQQEAHGLFLMPPMFGTEIDVLVNPSHWETVRLPGWRGTSPFIYIGGVFLLAGGVTCVAGLIQVIQRRQQKQMASQAACDRTL